MRRASLVEGDEAEAEFLAEQLAEVEFVLGRTEEEPFRIFGKIFPRHLEFDEDDFVDVSFDELLGQRLAFEPRNENHVERSNVFGRHFEKFENPFPRGVIDVKISGCVRGQVVDTGLLGPIIGESDCEGLFRH